MRSGNANVSIPSQAGILLAGPHRGADQPAWRRLNTLSGGHPLGGPPPRPRRTHPCGLNTLSGGHPLGGGIDDASGPHRLRLNTLSGGHPLGGTPPIFGPFRMNASQYPLRRASSWRYRRSPPP